MEKVKFTDVRINDDFWSGRQKQSLIVGIEACADNLKDSIDNFVNDAKVIGGEDYKKYEMKSNFAADSDVYKLMEGMAYAVSNYKDSKKPEETAAVKKIMEYLDDWTVKIGAAQYEDGYLNSLYTLKNSYGGGAGGTETGLTSGDRFKVLPWHEFYCAGHLYEAAIAIYNATGDRRMLDIAVKNFDLLYNVFIEKNNAEYNPGEWSEPGHEEIELALIKLAPVLESIPKYGKSYAVKCIEFSQMVMDTSRVIHGDSKVVTNKGMAAVTRGPLTYAVEQIDNSEDYNDYCIPDSTVFKTVWTDKFIQDNTYKTASLQLLEAKAQTLEDYYAKNGKTTKLTMIPFYAWANRGLTPMKVYMSNGGHAPTI